MNIHPQVLRTFVFAIIFGLAMKLMQMLIQQRRGVKVSNFHIVIFTCATAIFIARFGFIDGTVSSVLVGILLFAGFWIARSFKN